MAAKDRDALVKNLSTLIAGLAVPVSTGTPLGAAGPAWTKLHGDLVGFGWATAEVYEVALREALGLPTLANEADR